jgi:hypothetical protein
MIHGRLNATGFIGKSTLTLAGLGLAALLAGCATDSVFPNTTSPGASLAIGGTAFGGQQAISGSHVHVMQAVSTGYGNASASLLYASSTVPSTCGANGTSACTDSIGNYVQTTSTGSWSVPTGAYTCTAGAQVYILATQGNPGLTAGSNNPSIGLLAGLGVCPAGGSLATSFPHVALNEATTVITAYALAGYFTDATHLATGGSSLSTTGINNAAANINVLGSVVTGLANTASPNTLGTVPQKTIYLLSNILASCNNSTGSACTSLFGYAMNGSVTPTDTATAAINIAHNPGTNVQQLYGLVTSTGPFQPTPSAQPNDLSLTVHYVPTTALLSTNGKGGFIAIDASGNVWGPGANAASAVEISPLGALTHTITFTPSSNGQYYPVNVSVSPAGTIWAANYQLGSAAATASAFTLVSDSAASFAGTELAAAFDTSNDAWTANNYPASFGEFSPSGGYTATYQPSGIAPGSSPTTYPNQLLAVAVDSANHIWGVCNHCSGTSTSGSGLTGNAAEIANTGTAVSGTGGDTPSSIVYPSDVAIDSSNNAWISDFNGYVTKYNSSNVLQSGTGYPASGKLGSLNSLAIDGNNVVWLAQSNATTGTGVIYSMSSAGALTSPSGGYQAPLPSGVYYNDNSIAVDGSGNLWVSDYSGGLHEVIGIATPVVTPITPSKLATRP